MEVESFYKKDDQLPQASVPASSTGVMTCCGVQTKPVDACLLKSIT